VNSQIGNRFLPQIILLIVLAVCHCLTTTSAIAAPEKIDPLLNKSAPNSQSVLAKSINYTPKKMVVGVYLNGQSKLDSLYIWGEEHNSVAIDFQKWLLPIDKLTQATGWQTKEIGNQLEILAGDQLVRVPLLVTPPASGLGRAVSIKDLQAIPRLSINFDAQKYSIDLTVPPVINNSALPVPENLTQPTPSISQTIQPQTVVPQITPPRKFSPDRLLVGLNINGRSKLEGFYVWGQENGAEAVGFEDWLMPFDELSQSLGWKIKEIEGQLEVSTGSQRFRLASNKVIVDRNIGRAIAVRDIAAIPGYSVNFDIYKYAIDISVPGAPGDKFTPIEPPIVLEGLASARPPALSTSIIQQRLNSSGSANSSTITEPQGELQATGNIGDAGWYLRFNQPNITDTRNWSLSEAVVVRQNSSNDQILGTQSPFWRSRNNGVGSYWGATTVYRNGFEPPNRFSGGNYSLNERLQARRSSRVISGAAEPGTLVQLVRNDRTQLLQETLVDSSGIYRFDNIVVSGNLDDTFIGREYQVLLYPRGQLTANPTVRDISFTTFSGQIPVGADAFVISAGANRLNSGNFGSFDAVQGGVLYRRGLTDTLTAGVGVAYDREVRGVGEFFWQPSVPLEIAATATTGLGLRRTIKLPTFTKFLFKQQHRSIF
jgi:hypothetical protein